MTELSSPCESQKLFVKRDVLQKIKEIHPKLYLIEKDSEVTKLEPEKDDGHIEYKRNLTDCNEWKAEKYATQMRWRISENVKCQRATYYIGVDDDGTIIGLTQEELIESVNLFVLISNKINASIFMVEIINTNSKCFLRIGVKIKKIDDNYLVDFDEKVDYPQSISPQKTTFFDEKVDDKSSILPQITRNVEFFDEKVDFQQSILSDTQSTIGTTSVSIGEPPPVIFN